MECVCGAADTVYGDTDDNYRDDIQRDGNVNNLHIRRGHRHERCNDISGMPSDNRGHTYTQCGMSGMLRHGFLRGLIFGKLGRHYTRRRTGNPNTDEAAMKILFACVVVAVCIFIVVENAGIKRQR